jgi:hypothetical protein
MRSAIRLISSNSTPSAKRSQYHRKHKNLDASAGRFSVAARALKQARVGVVTIRQLEASSHEPRPATLQVVRHALERAGVRRVHRRERWGTRCTPSEVAKAEAVRTGSVALCETNPIWSEWSQKV